MKIKLMGTAALIALLGGCMGNQVEALRGSDAEGPGFEERGFNAELSREYKELAFYEADKMYDWADADRFAEKALTAAEGGLVSPETLKSRAIAEDKKRELAEARSRLTVLLGKGAGKTEPQAMARAQASFDCWLEQQEEGHQPAHIAACREAFLASLESAELALAPQPEPAFVPAKATVTLDEPEVEDFVLYFDFDSAALDDKAAQELEKAIEAAADPAVSVAITGHADRAGGEDYNLKLSLGRANRVLDALVAKGINPDRIMVEGRGETVPAVKTADGAKEGANRRVEIKIR